MCARRSGRRSARSASTIARYYHLLRALNDSSDLVRAAAAWALGRSGRSGRGGLSGGPAGRRVDCGGADGAGAARARRGRPARTRAGCFGQRARSSRGKCSGSAASPRRCSHAWRADLVARVVRTDGAAVLPHHQHPLPGVLAVRLCGARQSSAQVDGTRDGGGDAIGGHAGRVGAGARAQRGERHRRHGSQPADAELPAVRGHRRQRRVDGPHARRAGRTRSGCAARPAVTTRPLATARGAGHVPARVRHCAKWL